MSQTADEALKTAISQLRGAGVADPARDARRLLAHALDCPPSRLTLALPERISRGALARLATMVAARKQHQPVAQILGLREFRGQQFRVTRAVLDPRPETEILVEKALALGFHRVLDLGCGSGCILLSLLAERADATGLGVDISPGALKIAAVNAGALGVASRADLRVSDWFSDVEGTFDLIVANPPYIAAHEMAGLARDVVDWEPALALIAGPVGTEAYRSIARDIAAHLAPGGHALLEIGPTQGAEVSRIFQSTGLELLAIHPDLDGRDRVIALRRRG